MKMAYVFISDVSHKVLSTMIMPQVEQGKHGADVTGMFFVQDRTYFLLKDSPLAARVKALMDKTNMAVVACDQCVYEREIEKSLVDGVTVGCFPDFLAALAERGVDQVITI